MARLFTPGLRACWLGCAALLTGPATAFGSSWHRSPFGLTVATDNQQVEITWYGPSAVRVLKRPLNHGEERPSLAVIRCPLAPAAWNCEEAGGAIEMRTDKLEVAVTLSGGEVSFRDGRHALLLKEGAPGLLYPAGVPGEPTALSVSQRFALSNDEAVYGLGQHQDGFMNYRGRSVKLVQANTQSSIPFWVSTRGYGVLWDNPSSSRFTDSTDGCTLWSEVADGVDYYVVAGGSIDGAIAGYRTLTGAAPMYGRWAYGYWQSKEHYQNRDEVLGVAAEYRRRGIPIDNLVQDWDYWPGREHWNQLFFDRALFPRPTEMISRLHADHFHFMISVWCGFGPETPVYQELDRGGFLFPTTGWAGFRFFDVYNPAATDIYWQHLKNGLFEHGVDAWWMDSTEPDIVNAGTKDAEEYEMKKVRPNHLGTFARYLNTYPLLATESVYRHQRAATDRKRVYILTRSAFAGQQRAGATTWSGDIGASWPIYRRQIAAGLNHSMAGLPYWTFDIGGFVLGSYGGVFPGGGKSPAYQELYTRMFQFGAFCPIFRSHGSETPREIWEFGVYTPALVAADRLRYRLMPYIYANAWRTTHEGYTPMRGLAMDFPSDRAGWPVADEFLFGPSLLVAPVTEPVEHPAPLPSVPVTAGYFSTADGSPGLRATYFGDDHFGRLVREERDAAVDLDWYTGWAPFITNEKFSMRWEGVLTPTETGPHRFHFKTYGPRLLTIDGRQVDWEYQSVEAVSVPVMLQAGRHYAFSAGTSNGVLGAFKAQLFWKTPSQLAAETGEKPGPARRSVYLPAGTPWTDFWTGESVLGGRSVEADAPIDHLPLFVRAGAIVPMGPAVQYAAEQPDAPLELRVYPGRNGSFTLYDDEGDSYDYEKSARATTRIAWDDRRRVLSFGGREGSYPGMPAERRFKIVVVGVRHGAGAEPAAAVDAELSYSGQPVEVTLQRR